MATVGDSAWDVTDRIGRADRRDPGLVPAGGAQGRGAGGCRARCGAARTTSFAPVLRVSGRRNRTIVSYMSGLISVRCLFCPGVIDNSHQCFMNGPNYRPNKSPSRVVSTGKDEHQLRYGQGYDLENHLIKALGE
jgi:hypothetical protein